MSITNMSPSNWEDSSDKIIDWLVFALHFLSTKKAIVVSIVNWMSVCYAALIQHTWIFGVGDCVFIGLVRTSNLW